MVNCILQTFLPFHLYLRPQQEALACGACLSPAEASRNAFRPAELLARRDVVTAARAAAPADGTTDPSAAVASTPSGTAGLGEAELAWLLVLGKHRAAQASASASATATAADAGAAAGSAQAAAAAPAVTAGAGASALVQVRMRRCCASATLYHMAHARLCDPASLLDANGSAKADCSHVPATAAHRLVRAWVSLGCWLQGRRGQPARGLPWTSPACPHPLRMQQLCYQVRTIII